MLTPLGLAAYMAFLWGAVGDPLAFWTAHARGWHVQLQWTLAAYWRETYWILSRLARMQGYTHLLDVTRIFLPLIFGALSVSAYRRLGAVAGAYAALATLVAVLFAPDSVGREFLAVTPAFAAAGLPALPGRMGEALRAFSLALLFIFLFAFVTGHFVG